MTDNNNGLRICYCTCHTNPHDFLYCSCKCWGKRVSQSIKIKPSIHKKAKMFALINNIQFSRVVELALHHKINHKEGWLNT